MAMRLRIFLRGSGFYILTTKEKFTDRISGYISLQRFFMGKCIKSLQHGTSNHVGHSDSGNDLRLRYTAFEESVSLLSTLLHISLFSIKHS